MTEVNGVVKQVQRRLTLEQQSEVVQRYQAGAQMSYLAQHFGVHRSTVSAILKRHGVSTRQSGLSADQIDQAVLLYGQGKSLAAIGNKLALTQGRCTRGFVSKAFGCEVLKDDRGSVHGAWECRPPMRSWESCEQRTSLPR